MFDQDQTSRDADQPIAGRLINRRTREPLAGYRVVVDFGEGSRHAEAERPIWAAFSQLDGAFAIPLNPEMLAQGIRSEEQFSIIVQNRFERVVHANYGVSSRELLVPLEIVVDVREEDEHPPERQRTDPFDAFQSVFEIEVVALRRAGTSSLAQLLQTDLDAFGRHHELSEERLAAFRLAAEVGSPEDLTGDEARVLVAAGIKGAAELVMTPPDSVYRKVRHVRANMPFDMPEVDTSRVLQWQAAARGWRTDMLKGRLDIAELEAAFRPISEQIVALNPGLSLTVLRASQLGRMEGIAEMRSLMVAAGVYDLSSLGEFRVRNPYRVGPGYHIAPPRMVLSTVASLNHMQQLIAQGGGFSKVKAVDLTQGFLHIVPNPVREAVILGSVVRFLDNGKLIIGKEVSKLIIITEEIKADVIKAIEYEGREEIPTTPAKNLSRPLVTRPEGGLNARNVYTDGPNNDGRDGLPGPPGMPGGPGRQAEPAPSLTMFVKNVPLGLPNIDLNGRKGGRGQDGQDGGHGEDGARGRESVSSAFWCETDVGNGGNGGRGGDGGQGGKGGQGGTAGTIKIFATPVNLPRLLSRPNVFLGMTGGPGGDGGDGGGPGDGGLGGWVGNDTGWCDADDGHEGTSGSLGNTGSHGERGDDGRHGAFEVQPITENDWNAAFTLPYLTRLEPASAATGQTVHVVGLNFTSLTKVAFDQQVLSTSAIDIARGTLEFVVPPSATGGAHVITLSVPVPANPVLKELSNALNLRVLPRISQVSPARALPGTRLTLQGSGFSTSADVRIDGKALPASVKSSTVVEFLLPGFATNDMPAGMKSIQVVNSDGEVSNGMPFELETEIVIRIKAWRVLDDDDDGTGRDDEDIREIFNHEFSPAAIWAAHGIRLEFDPNVAIARVSSILADTWPESSSAEAVTAEKQVLSPPPPTPPFALPGAINFYFVNDIDDWTAHAYARIGTAAKTNPPPFVIFEDTGWLSVEDEAHVAAHEIGHVFGLHHVCAKSDDSEDVPSTTFGRTCDENTDKDWLMYPKANRWTNEGNALTSSEITLVKSIARNLHRAAL